MEKRVCLISGGAGGIGAWCALEFSRRGWTVAASFYGDENPHATQELLTRELGEDAPEILPVLLNVVEDDSCRDAADTVIRKFGRIDALINCAGTTRFVPHGNLDDLSGDEFRRVYDVNLIGAFQLTRACATALRESGRGSIVNISSIAGLRGSGSSLAYAASKGALNSMTLSMARNLAPHVRVNAIAPGFVDGGLPARVLPADRYEETVAAQRASAPLRRVSEAKEIAEMAWFISERTPGMTGHVSVIDNGLLL